MSKIWSGLVMDPWTPAYITGEENGNHRNVWCLRSNMFTALLSSIKFFLTLHPRTPKTFCVLDLSDFKPAFLLVDYQ
jgi:hypothetical protein